MTKFIALLRHWTAQYQQLKQSTSRTSFRNDVDWFLQYASTIKDLVPEGIASLQDSIQQFCIEHQSLLQDKKIVVWISPYARTIDTASYLIQHLQSINYTIDKISLIDQLGEVDGFEWGLFDACVKWWTVQIDGQMVTLDPVVTNPDNLSHMDYFAGWHYRTLWIYDRIKSIETYDEITARSKNVLARTLQAMDNDTFVIMVTHQWRTDHIIVEKNNYQNWWLKPWEFLLYPVEKE